MNPTDPIQYPTPPDFSSKTDDAHSWHIGTSLTLWWYGPDMGHPNGLWTMHRGNNEKWTISNDRAITILGHLGRARSLAGEEV